ncbi:MAG: hypothetical protein AB8B91_18305 [Rubripirellula sp.]
MNCRRGVVSLLIFLGMLAVCEAETIDIGRAPAKPGVAGFVMNLKMEAVANNGYQPIYLKFAPLGKAFTYDRHIQVTVSPKNYSRTDLDYQFRCKVMLPEGAGPTEIPSFVPHYFSWENVNIELFEDGRSIETSKRNFSLANGLRSRFAQQKVTVGVLQPRDANVQDAAWKKCPDVRTLVTVLGDGPIPEDVGVKRLAHNVAVKRMKRVQPAFVQFRPIDESRLHSLWLGYTQLDVIIVAAPVLQRIEREQPEKFVELIDWLAAGGNLWITAASTGSKRGDFESRLLLGPPKPNKILGPAQVNAFLNLNQLNDTTDLMYEAWNGTRKQSSQYGFDQNSELSKRADIFKKLRNKQHPFAATSPKNEIAAQIRIGSFGLGTVVSIADEDPFPGSFQFWYSVIQLHEPGQLHWPQRMGVDVPRGNDNYWMWLIPSVGQPPVKSFVVLNTLFAILVGPLCYFFFRKRERLYLLYFVAPCLALIVTASLFAYALSADGVRTKVRARQLTWVDSTNQYSVTQSRQTYYAVLGASSGIEVTDDTAVFPVRNTPAHDRYYRGRRSGRDGTYVASQGSQLLTGGFLPPRDQVQYLTTRPNPMQQTLQFTWNAEGETGEVTSHFPFSIQPLLVCDGDGVYWKAEEVDANGTASLRPASKKELAEILDRRVLPPLEAVPMLRNNFRNWGGVTTGVQVSLLEARLDQWSKQLPAGSFVGLAETSKERIGVEDAVLLNSFQVLMGRIP